VYDAEKRRLQIPTSLHADVLSSSQQIRRGQFTKMFGLEPQPKLVVSTANFVDSMGLIENMDGSNNKITVWPPASLLPRSLNQPFETASLPKKKVSSGPLPSGAVGVTDAKNT
jgi:hypothetical protein